MKIIKYILVLLLFFSTINYAQDDLPRLSPKASVSQAVGYAEVAITYSRPGVKDREIWGKLVPYNEVWRTGANEATTIEFSKDVKIEGNNVPAGKYALFTIPGKNEWTVILNTVWDQWGAFNYDMEKDLLRFKVKPMKSDFTERLLFTFEYDSPYSADVVFEWNSLKFSFTIDTNEN